MPSAVELANFIGVLLFAASGVSSARSAEFDMFGAAIVAFITATGGGMLRDAFLARTPLALESNVIALIVLGVLLAFALFRPPEKVFQTKLFEALDVMGVVAFGIVGAQIAINNGLAPIGVLWFAFINANVGGVLRDILCGQRPLVLTKKWNGSISIAIGGAVLLCERLGLPAAITTPAILLAGMVLGALLNLSGLAMRRL